MFFAAMLAAAVTAPPTGSYAYVSTMGGAQIGRTQITVADSPQSVQLTESGSGSMNGQSGSIQDTLTLDAQLQPVSYVADASIADSRNMRSRIAFGGSEAQQSGDVTKTYRLAGTSKHFALLDVGPFSGFFMLPAQLHAWNNEPITAIVPNFAQSQLLAPDVTLKPTRPQSVPANDAVYSFSTMVSIAIWYDPRTFIVDEVDIPSESLIVRRT